MLHELRIAGLGVIEQANVSLGRGLTAVTGETGAGKTMILTGLNLILGAKASQDAVRVGFNEASAEAVLDLPADEPVSDVQADDALLIDAHASDAHGGDVTAGPIPLGARAAAEEAGAMIDADGTVTVLRVVGATTRSRSVLGGRTVPQALLAAVTSELVTVHGQSDQARLRTSAKQRQTLDSYAGAKHAANLERYKAAFGRWRLSADALERLKTSDEVERAKLAIAREDLATLTAANIERGERDSLVAEANKLDHVESLRASMATAHEALAGESEAAASAVLDAAKRAIDDAARLDPSLEPLVTRVADFVYGVADVAGEISSYVDRIDADPARLSHIQSRLASIQQLERRYGKTADELVTWRESLESSIGAGDDWEDILERAAAAEHKAKAERDALADLVSAARIEAATELSQTIGAELAGLAMPDAVVEVRVERREPGPSGADEVTFLLASHLGAPLRPVAEAASGGELSRIMLAIEVALANRAADTPRTFVFDEVDAGVGGKAAQAVGSRLAKLAAKHQVIVVTHLAQVAAYADQHVVVTKSSTGSVTVSQVGQVHGEDRVTEVARMLSGDTDSESARAHALELLEAARVSR